jgi:hypothetical protein
VKGKHRFSRKAWLYLLTLSKGRRILLFCGLYLLLLWALPDPDTFVVLEARSESVEFQVSNPLQAAFDVAGVSLLPEEEGEERDCLRALVQPPAQARVRYLRRGDDAVITTVEPTADEASRISTPDGTFELSGAFALLPQADCAQPTTGRFPVWGPVEIGEQLRAAASVGEEPPYVLLSGTLTVYGRSFSLPLIRPRSGLYHVSTIELPGGARLLTDSSVPDGRDQWWGMVLADDEDGLRTTLSTEASRVQLFPPGSRATPDVIEVGLFAQATGDPAIVALQALFLALFAIYQFASEIKSARDRD